VDYPRLDVICKGGIESAFGAGMARHLARACRRENKVGAFDPRQRLQDLDRVPESGTTCALPFLVVDKLDAGSEETHYVGPLRAGSSSALCRRDDCDSWISHAISYAVGIDAAGIELHFAI
jgi:hypothetical protein